MISRLIGKPGCDVHEIVPGDETADFAH